MRSILVPKTLASTLFAPLALCKDSVNMRCAGHTIMQNIHSLERLESVGIQARRCYIEQLHKRRFFECYDSGDKHSHRLGLWLAARSARQGGGGQAGRLGGAW